MALVGVELETLVSESDALTTNGFFIIKNIKKRIYKKRFNKFAFVVVSFNLLNFAVFLSFSIDWKNYEILQFQYAKFRSFS